MEIDEECKREIIQGVNNANNKIPKMLRGFIPPLPIMLDKVPICARKYSLDELIEFLQWAYDNGYIM